jgi:H+-transporting ATPase
MAPPDHPPNGDVENGNFEKELERGGANLAVANDEDQGEYGNLVRYISNYKDGRRASTIGGDDDDAPKKPWWKFWAKSGSGMGGDGFETPDDWLETNMKSGLTSQQVESRRKKTGWNELTTEKENMLLKFLSYFTGPILYGQ